MFMKILPKNVFWDEEVLKFGNTFHLLRDPDLGTFLKDS